MHRKTALSLFWPVVAVINSRGGNPMQPSSSNVRCLPGMLLLIAGMAILGFVKPSSARVTQMVVTKVESPTFGGTAFGSVGQYELIQGTITGEVDPSNPQNAVIVDIRNSPRNVRGMVSYSSDFQILRPIN